MIFWTININKVTITIFFFFKNTQKTSFPKGNLYFGVLHAIRSQNSVIFFKELHQNISKIVHRKCVRLHRLYSTSHHPISNSTQLFILCMIMYFLCRQLKSIFDNLLITKRNKTSFIYKLDNQYVLLLLKITCH